MMGKKMTKYLKNASRSIFPARYRAKWNAMTNGRCDPQSLCARRAASLVALLQRELRNATGNNNSSQYNNSNIINSSDSSYIMVYNNNNDNEKKTEPKVQQRQPSGCFYHWDMQKEGLSDVCVQQALAILDSDVTVVMHECSALALETLYEALLQIQAANMQHEQELALLVIKSLEMLENKLVTKIPISYTSLRESEQLALLRHMGKGVELLKLQNKLTYG